MLLKDCEEYLQETMKIKADSFAEYSAKNWTDIANRYAKELGILKYLSDLLDLNKQLLNNYNIKAEKANVA